MIKNEHNYGFSEGNNIAVSYALTALNPDYAVLLNNDTIVERHFLNKLVDVAEKERQTGLLQPKMLYYGDCTITWESNMIFFTSTRPSGNHQKDEGLHDDHRIDVFFNCKRHACVLIRRSLTDIGADKDPT